MVRGTRLARSATRFRHRLRGSHYGLRSFMLPRTASKTDDDVANGTDDERVRSPAQRHRLERSRRPAPPCTVPGRTAVAANDSGFRRSARLRRCGGRGDLVGQDDDAAAGDACADAACADARLAMLPRPHPPTVASPKPWGPPPAASVLRGPPTHDARSVGAVKAYPSSVGVTVVRAVRSLKVLCIDMGFAKPQWRKARTELRAAAALGAA